MNRNWLIAKLILTGVFLAVISGCTSAPKTQEQKEQEAMSRAYEAITSGRSEPSPKK